MMKKDPLVAIKNLKRTAKYIGKDVAKNRGIPLEDLSHYIRPREIVSIIKQFAIEKEEKYLLNTKLLQKIFTEVHDWVLGVSLSKMASNDIIDTYWDSELNCMTFSKKDDQEHGKKII
jgi:hypothetical protein